MFQRVTLIGNLGSDPEMRYTENGVPATSFSIATSETISKDGPNGPRSCPEGWVESYNGKNWELTTWWRVTCWRGLAETVNKFLAKGRQVFVEGRVKGTALNGKLYPHAWKDKSGQARASFEITADTVKFLSSNGGTREIGPTGEQEEERPF